MRLRLEIALLFMGIVVSDAKHPKDFKIANLVTQNKLPDHQLVVNLEEAVTTLARQNLLQAEDFIFDFNHLAKDPAQRNSGAPNPRTGFAMGLQGNIATANSASFPALIGEDVSMSIGTIGPCGMNTPHTHPRATEFNYVVTGNFSTGMLQENMARYIMGNVTAGQASLFPRGSIHFEANLGCETAIFVAAFSNPEAGVLQVAQGFFGLAPTVLDPTLGHSLTRAQEQKLHAMIPANVALGLKECIQRCKIKVPVISALILNRLLERTHITGYAYGSFVIALLIFFGSVHLGHSLGLDRRLHSVRRIQKYLMYAPTLFGPPPPNSKKAKLNKEKLQKRIQKHPEQADVLTEKSKHPYPGMKLPARGDIILISLFWIANLVLTVWDLDEEQPAREAFQRTGWLGIWNTIAVVILSLKASPLPWIVGKSHDGLVFYHKWIALTAFIQVWIHSIWGLFIIKYMYTDNVFRWTHRQTGAFISTIAFTIIVVVAWAPWIAKKHFEMFLVFHVAGYVALLVGLWLHNPLLIWYVVVLISLWVLDRLMRLLFLFYLRGFRKQYATLMISNQSTKVIIERRQKWSAGSHVYVNFPDCKPLQSHPYTIASIVNRDESVQEVVLRIQRSGPHSTGFSNALYDLVHKKGQICDLPINYHGPYGAAPNVARYTRILCIGGGSGITMPIALLQSFCAMPEKDPTACTLVWCTRDIADFTAFDLVKIKSLGVHIYLCETRKKQTKGMLAALAQKFEDVTRDLMPDSTDRGQVTEIDDGYEIESVHRSDILPSKNNGFVATQEATARNTSRIGTMNDMERVLQQPDNRNASTISQGMSDMERAIGSLNTASSPSSQTAQPTNHRRMRSIASVAPTEEEIETFSTNSTNEIDINNEDERHPLSTSAKGHAGQLTLVPIHEYFGHKTSPQITDTADRIAAVRANSSFLSDTRTTMHRTSEKSGTDKHVGVSTSQVEADDNEFSPVVSSIEALQEAFGEIGSGRRPIWENVLATFLENANEDDRLCVLVCGGAGMCRDVRNAVAKCPATQAIDLHVEQFG